MPEFDTPSGFSDNMRGWHRSNKSSEYKSVSQIDDGVVYITEVTRFIYEFFLYNSVYQIEWEESFRDKNISHNQKKLEPLQQDDLEKFLTKHDTQAESLLIAFVPLMDLELNGAWTTVTPDAYTVRNPITDNWGVEFFKSIKEIERAVRQRDSNNPDALFKHVEECRNFIYKVRCNIFHGNKLLGELYNDDQKKRIKVYFEFLHCLMEWFFIVADKQRTDT